MIRALDRIPLDKRKSAISGLLSAAIMMFLFGLLSIMAFSETETTKSTGHLWWKESETSAVSMDQRITWLLIGIGLMLLALLGVIAALRLISQEGRLKRYVAILKGVEQLSVHQLAAITRSDQSSVYQDIEMMISSGMLEDYYVDYEGARIVSKKYVPAESNKTVVTCSGCGANNDLIVGITKSCAYCHQPLVLQR